MNPRKTSPATEASHGATVRETEQKNFDESGICGAPPQITKAGTGMNTKWIVAGAAGAGLLICVLECFGGNSGGKPPLSASKP